MVFYDAWAVVRRRPGSSGLRGNLTCAPGLDRIALCRKVGAQGTPRCFDTDVCRRYATGEGNRREDSGIRLPGGWADRALRSPEHSGVSSMRGQMAGE